MDKIITGQTPEYLKQFVGFREQRSFEELIRALPTDVKEGALIVDAMAGTGMVGRYVNEYLRKKGVDVRLAFLDRDPAMLSDSSYDEEENRYCEDITQQTSFADGEAQIVIVRCGLNNLSKKLWKPALKELLRILTPHSGCLILQDHFPRNVSEWRRMTHIETRIAQLDRRAEQPYIATIHTLTSVIRELNGQIVRTNIFEYEFNLADRLMAKGLIREAERERFNRNLVYPITTLSIQKN